MKNILVLSDVRGDAVKIAASCYKGEYLLTIEYATDDDMQVRQIVLTGTNAEILGRFLKGEILDTADVT